MNKVVKNFLAVLLGLVVGGLVNMALVLLGSWLIPAPAGVDTTSAESLNQSIHLLQPQHFLFPFLAHALGTLAGAMVACRIAASRSTLCAFVVGAMFLAGGIAAATMIPAPTWYIALDLTLAYLPMAWLAGRLARGRDKAKTATPIYPGA